MQEMVSTRAMGAGINFDGTVYRSREDLCEQWAIYFRPLYTGTDAPDFDDNFKDYVSSVISDTLGNITLNQDVTVEQSFVQRCIQDLSNGKAGGVDGVSHEDLIAASRAISPILANIYTWMLRLGHVPEEIKNSAIITLHKGGKNGRTTRTIIDPLLSLVNKQSWIPLADNKADSRNSLVVICLPSSSEKLYTGPVNSPRRYTCDAWTGDKLLITCGTMDYFTNLLNSDKITLRYWLFVLCIKTPAATSNTVNYVPKVSRSCKEQSKGRSCPILYLAFIN